MDPLDIQDEEILQFLYQGIGLQWELNIYHHQEMTSTRAHPEIRVYLHEHQIELNICAIADIPQEQEIGDNSFYFTANSQNTVASLLHHLRNSIMHGNYNLEQNGDVVIINCWDVSRAGAINMKGRIYARLLHGLIQIIIG